MRQMTPTPSWTLKGSRTSTRRVTFITAKRKTTIHPHHKKPKNEKPCKYFPRWRPRGDDEQQRERRCVRHRQSVRRPLVSPGKLAVVAEVVGVADFLGRTILHRLDLVGNAR